MIPSKLTAQHLSPLITNFWIANGKEENLKFYVKALHQLHHKKPLSNVPITNHRYVYTVLLDKFTFFPPTIYGAIFLAMAAQKGKEGLASGMDAFYNEKTTHDERLRAFKAYFDEKKRYEKSDECSTPVHPTSGPDWGESESSCALLSQRI